MGVDAAPALLVPAPVAPAAVAVAVLVVAAGRAYARVHASGLVASVDAPCGLAVGPAVNAIAVVGPVAGLAHGRRRPLPTPASREAQRHQVPILGTGVPATTAVAAVPMEEEVIGAAAGRLDPPI